MRNWKTKKYFSFYGVHMYRLFEKYMQYEYFLGLKKIYFSI